MKTHEEKVVDFAGVEERADGMVRFHCRFETAVETFFMSGSGRMSPAVRDVLERFGRCVRGGLLNLKCRSRFKGRADLKDKVERVVRLEVRDKDLLEKLAFSLRISQAEVLRMALEWFMEAVAVASPEGRIKWHHELPMLGPVSLRFAFSEYGRLLEWQIPPPGLTGEAFRSILGECKKS